MQIIDLRDQPDRLEQAAGYFSSKWGIDKRLYVESMQESFTPAAPVRWYLLVREGRIVGGCGLIENDFMVRTDLKPWLCALYVEEDERGKQLGAKLLRHACAQAHALGFQKVYLNTDHIGYYEKYGWRFIGEHAHRDGGMARVYEADAPGAEPSE